MASISERGFGARLAAARSIHTHLQSFGDYAPPSAALSAGSYGTAIDDLSALHEQTVTAGNAYRAAAKVRQGHFTTVPGSIDKMLAPIAAAVRAAFGKDSSQMTQVGELISKIRGSRPGRAKSAAASGGGPVTDTISQSERSFGSVTQSFADLINTLRDFKEAYAPANEAIRVPALETKLGEVSEANTAVTETSGELKKKRDRRLADFEALNNTSTRIKDAVQSQYGLGSSQHDLVKKLKV